MQLRVRGINVAATPSQKAFSEPSKERIILSPIPGKLTATLDSLTAITNTPDKKGKQKSKILNNIWQNRKTEIIFKYVRRVVRNM